MQFYRRIITAWLLNLLLPGLGHFFWKEYAFGLFVYLVMLLATVLYVASFFVPLPDVAVWFILGLPVLFYAFTFVDLARTVRLKRRSVDRGTKALVIVLVIGLAHQLFSPAALLNFGYRNRPELYRMPHNRLNPLYATDDLLTVSRLTYFVKIAFVDKPILHELPERFDMVCFEDDTGRRRIGFVVGLPLEELVIVEGLVVADGIPDPRDGPLGISLSGDWPLTEADRFSILVATVSMGSLDQVYEVPLTKLVGKVDKLF
jgi:hypothetical protein